MTTKRITKAILSLVCIQLTACTLSNKNSTNSRTEQDMTGHQQLSTTTLYPSLGIEKTIFFSEYGDTTRSEEHTSELQSRPHLVCRLLLEKKKKKIQT